MSVLSRALSCAVSGLFVLSACGSSGTEAVEPTDVAPQDVADEASTPTTAEASTDSGAETAPPESVAEEESASAGSVVRVSGGSTDPWELPAECEWNPDNVSAASTVLSMKDTDDSGQPDIDIFEVWPITIDDDSETSLIGFLTEPNGTMLVLIDVETTSEGDTITTVANAHDGFKTFDDPPDYTLTITCGP